MLGNVFGSSLLLPLLSACLACTEASSQVLQGSHTVLPQLPSEPKPREAFLDFRVLPFTLLLFTPTKHDSDSDTEGYRDKEKDEEPHRAFHALSMLLSSGKHKSCDGPQVARVSTGRGAPPLGGYERAENDGRLGPGQRGEHHNPEAMSVIEGQVGLGLWVLLSPRSTSRSHLHPSTSWISM